MLTEVIYFYVDFSQKCGEGMSKTESIKGFFKAVLLSVFIGIICGIAGNVFAKVISLVTVFRGNNGWVLYLLCLFGIIITAVYKGLKVQGAGTNNVIGSVRTNKPVSPTLSIAVFCGTVLSHLGGASVGREGAALQLGGSISEYLAKVFKIEEKYRQILVMSGMAGCFSALFGTPIAAFIFVLEVVRVGKRCFRAMLPVFLSSGFAFLIATGLGSQPESFPLDFIPSLSFDTAWKFVLISVAGSLVSMVFAYALHFSEKLFKKFIENDYVRVVAGGAIIILLTKVLGTTDYNGGGINIVQRIFTDGEVYYEAFLLKIIFTAISVGSGYRGGEIVPTVFIGGTLGGALGLLTGLNPAFSASIGIIALFSGVTNCPFATVMLGCEMFGISGVGYFTVASAISYGLSGKVSIYSGRKTPFVKNHD